MENRTPSNSDEEAVQDLLTNGELVEKFQVFYVDSAGRRRVKYLDGQASLEAWKAWQPTGTKVRVLRYLVLTGKPHTYEELKL